MQNGKNLVNLMPKDNWLVDIADVDVGGDYHRVIIGGIPIPKGLSAFEMRHLITSEFDSLRSLMIAPPMGHEDMCANLTFPSTSSKAPFGQVIMECMGYPYFSGSNTAATLFALMEAGMLPKSEGSNKITHEVPAGLIQATATVKNNVIEEMIVEGDASYVINPKIRLALPDYGKVDVALVWSGALFATVDAEQFGLKINTADFAKMKAIGLAICEAIEPDFEATHPSLGPLEAPKFVNFLGPITQAGPDKFESTGAIYGHPNTIFRCPTGTGTAARMAYELEKGRMQANDQLTNTSPISTQFVGHGLGLTEKAGLPMLRVNISSRPYTLMRTQMNVDFQNPSLSQFSNLRSFGH
jgi:proline racemase